VRIRSQIILSMVSAAALIGLVGGVAIFTQMTATKFLGLTEATNVARELADTIVFKPTAGAPSLLEQPAVLKQFLELEHRRSQRDFIIVDRNKVVVAHAADEEHKAGEKFDHDPGNEVGQTLADGIPRKFVDANEANAILAVPIEQGEDTIVGAVLLEYDRCCTRPNSAPMACSGWLASARLPPYWSRRALHGCCSAVSAPASGI
jgi:hypothetical protein